VKFTIQGSTLHRLVEGVNTYSDGLGSSPVCLGALDDWLYVERTTDSDGARTSGEAAITEEGEWAVSWRRLRAVARALKNSEFVHVTSSCEADEQKCWVSITDEQMTARLVGRRLEQGLSSRWPVASDESHNITLRPRAIADVLPFASKEECRPVLAAVAFDEGDYMATDSYRLGAIQLSDRSPHSFLIPRSFARFLVTTFSEEEIAATYEEGGVPRLWVNSETVCAYTDLVYGSTVSWRSLIPDFDRMPHRIAFQEGLLDLALKLYRTASVMGRRERNVELVKVRPDDDDHIKLVTTIGEDEISVRVKAKTDMDVDLFPNFNARYLCDIYRGTNVDTLFGSGLKPWGVFEDAEEIAKDA
jgi:hypothetical protein